MLMLCQISQEPMPSPAPDPEPEKPADRLVRVAITIWLAAFLICFAAAVFFFYREMGEGAMLRFSAAATPVLCFPEQLARTIRQRAYRRVSKRATAEERRRMYLLNMGKLDLYQREFGEPPVEVPTVDRTEAIS